MSEEQIKSEELEDTAQETAEEAPVSRRLPPNRNQNLLLSLPLAS